jgi:hypothetical protein
MHVTDLYFLGACNHPKCLALSGDGSDFTYLETQALSNRIARRLAAARLGIGPRRCMSCEYCPLRHSTRAIT